MQALVLSKMAPSGPPTTTQTVHPAPGTSSVPTRPASGVNPVQHYNEKPVVLPMICMPWPDGSEQLLQTGSIVFCGRNTLGMRNNLVSLYKMNEVLRSGANMSRSRLGLPPLNAGAKVPSTMRELENSMLTNSTMSQNLSQIHNTLSLAIKSIKPSADAIGFLASDGDHAQTLLRLNIEKNLVQDEEDRINQIKQAKPEDMKDPLIALGYSSLNRAENQAFASLLGFYVNHKDTALRYITIDGIRNMWNFLGVVNNTNRGKGMQSLPALLPSNGSGQIPPIVANVIVQRQCVVPNIWGDDVNEMSHLYLVLTREYMGKKDDGTEIWDDYQIVPWSSKNQGEIPPPSLLCHEDHFGREAVGIYFYVGAVTHRNSGMAPTDARRRAAGLRPRTGGDPPGLIKAWEQNGALDTLEVQLKMFQ